MLSPDAGTEKFVTKSIPEEIASVLQTEIISGGYLPGQRLVERELSTRFKVSSIPIREALQVLERRGVVRRKPNRGCSVVQLSLEEVNQICELREFLEPKVAEWAACRITAEGAERLLSHVARIKEIAETGDLPQFFQEDIQFHRAVWELSQNPFAARALEHICGSLFACGYRESRGIDLDQEYKKHERLADSIINGRPCAASKLLEEIAKDLRRYLNSRLGGA